MTNRILEAIDLADQGDVAGFRKIIFAELFTRAAEEIDARRVVVAQGLFAEASEDAVRAMHSVKKMDRPFVSGDDVGGKPNGITKAPRRPADSGEPGNPSLSEHIDMVAEEYGLDYDELVEALIDENFDPDELDEGIISSVIRAAANKRSLVKAAKHAAKNAAKAWVPGSTAWKVARAKKAEDRKSANPRGKDFEPAGREQVAAGRKGWGGNAAPRTNRLQVRADIATIHKNTEAEIEALKKKRYAEMKARAQSAGLNRDKDGKSRFPVKGFDQKPEQPKPSPGQENVGRKDTPAQATAAPTTDHEAKIKELHASSWKGSPHAADFEARYRANHRVPKPGEQKSAPSTNDNKPATPYAAVDKMSDEEVARKSAAIRAKLNAHRG